MCANRCNRGHWPCYCLRLAKEGWRVLLVGRNIKQLAALQLECGNDAEYFQADLSNSESRNDLAKFAQQIGGATLLINNAGVNVMQGFSEISEQQIDHLLNINLNVPIKLCQLFLPQITRNKGTIVNMVHRLAASAIRIKPCTVPASLALEG